MDQSGARTPAMHSCTLKSAARALFRGLCRQPGTLRLLLQDIAEGYPGRTSSAVERLCTQCACMLRGHSVSLHSSKKQRSEALGVTRFICRSCLLVDHRLAPSSFRTEHTEWYCIAQCRCAYIHSRSVAAHEGMVEIAWLFATTGTVPWCPCSSTRRSRRTQAALT